MIHHLHHLKLEDHLGANSPEDCDDRVCRWVYDRGQASDFMALREKARLLPEVRAENASMDLRLGEAIRQSSIIRSKPMVALACRQARTGNAANTRYEFPKQACPVGSAPQ